MPRLTGLKEHVVETEMVVFRLRISQHPSRVKQRYEPVHIRVFIHQCPVKPTRLVSWQYALLFPSCVRRTSSPIRNIGRPSESSVMAKKFFTWRFRSFSISGSSLRP